MRYLVISDLHFSPQVNKNQLAILKRLIGEVDQVVVNGDLWDIFLGTFSQFINSGWQELFPALLAKNTVYLYGNHDPAQISGPEVGLFSTHQAHEWDFELAGKTYHIEHGDKLIPAHNTLYHARPNAFTMSFSKYFDRWEERRIALQGDRYGRFANSLQRWSWRRRKQAGVDFLVVGHTHSATLDIERGYLNSGVNKYGYLQYLILSEDGPELVKSRV